MPHYSSQDNKVNLLHIESRSSKRSIGDYEFIVEIDTVSGDVNTAIEGLRKESSYFQIISRDHKDGNGRPRPGKSINIIKLWQVSDKWLILMTEETIPWFPGRIQDLDRFANQILSYGSELDADHPGFTDPVYRARRKEFADIAFHYK